MTFYTYKQGHNTALEERKSFCTKISFDRLTGLSTQEGWLYRHRQQHVRQRQKLISIIDYDVYMTFY